MDHLGIDGHKNESQLCILGEQGERKEQRIRTTPERFAAVLGERPRARILLEASTESEWVARCLERLGHEVIVADRTLPRCTRPGRGRSRLIGGTRGRGPRPAGWGRTARRIGCPTLNAMCVGA